MVKNIVTHAIYDVIIYGETRARVSFLGGAEMFPGEVIKKAPPQRVFETGHESHAVVITLSKILSKHFAFYCIVDIVAAIL